MNLSLILSGSLRSLTILSASCRTESPVNWYLTWYRMSHMES